MKKFIISIDAGTTSNRSILFDLKGKPVYSSQKEFTQYFPKNGWVEHDPDEIWRTTLKTLKGVCSPLVTANVDDLIPCLLPRGTSIFPFLTVITLLIFLQTALRHLFD